MAPAKNSKSENAFVASFSATRDEIATAIEKEKHGQAPNEEEKAAKKEIDITEHLMTVDEVVKKWDSDPTRGLTDQQVIQKREIHGKNCLTPPPRTPLWLIFIGHLTGYETHSTIII